MRRLIGVLAVLVLVLGAAGEADAVLTLAGSNGTVGATVLYEGPATYVFATAGTFLGVESTIIGKTLTSLGGNVLLATFNTAADADFTAGFQWSERITNGTGQAWSGLTIALNGGLAGFGDFLVVNGAPSQITITDANFALPPDPLITQISPANGTTVTVSPDELSVTFTFGTPVAAGSMVEIFIPIENLPADSEFELTETPIAAAAQVPEPGTLVLLGAGLAGLGVLGRKRWATGASV